MNTGTGHYQGILDNYAEALDDPTSNDVCTKAEIYSNRSQVFLQLNRPSEALNDALSALSLRPRWPTAHLRAGQSHAALANVDHAIAAYKRALELEPSLKTDQSTTQNLEALLKSQSQSRCRAVMVPEEELHSKQAVYSAALCPMLEGEAEAPLHSYRQRVIAAAYADGCIRVWCAMTGAQLQTLRSHTAAVTAVSWGRCGDLLASGSLDCTAKIWQRHRSCNSSRTMLDGDIPRPCNDSSSASADDSSVWSQLELLTTLSGHERRVSGVLFGPHDEGGGSTVITASPDQTVRVWALPSGDCLHCLNGHSALVSDIALSPAVYGPRTDNNNQTILVSACGDAVFRLWDAHNGFACIQDVSWESGPVVACGFLPTRTCQSQLERSNNNSRCPAPPPGPLLLTAHAQLARQEGRILLWDVIDRKHGWVDGRLSAPTKCINGIQGRPTDWAIGLERPGRVQEQSGGGGGGGAMLLAVASSDGVVRVWDITDSPSPLFSFQMHAGGGRADIEGGCTIHVPLPWTTSSLQHSSNSHALVAFSPSARFLAATVEGACIVTQTAFSSGQTEGTLSPATVSVRSVEDGEEICAFIGHTGVIRGLQWIGDSELLTAAEDGTLRVWQVPDPI